MNILDLIKNDYCSTKIKDGKYCKLIQDRESLEKDICNLLEPETIKLFKRYIELVDCVIAFQIDYALEFSYTKHKQLIREIYLDISK